MKNFSIALPPVLAIETPAVAGNARPTCLTDAPCAAGDAPATHVAHLDHLAPVASTPTAAPPAPQARIGADREEIADWLRLCHTPGVPPGAVRRLLTAFGPPAAIFGVSRAALADVIPREIATRLLARTSPELHARIALTREWADRPGCAVVTLCEPAYPRALLTLGDPPPILYCRGDAGLANRTGNAGDMAAALVGSRRATPQGRDNARHFARALGDAGVTVVSGLAAGIDAAAHEGALETVGGTCAVIGTGADVVYPARHRALAERVAARGLLLSAFPIGTPPRPEHFPRRNRLIAALARCTVVMEATTHSGSLITARLAGELGRDVLAVPGSIHAPQSQGCHVLIRDGATLAGCVEDVFEAMGIAAPVTSASAARDTGRPCSTARRPRTHSGASPAATPTCDDVPRGHDGWDGDRNDDGSDGGSNEGSDVGNATRPAAVHATMQRESPTSGASTAPPPGTTAILEALGYDPVSADTLRERSGLSIAAVLSQLGALELDGRIARLPGGRFVRREPPERR
ncbi:SMF protein [Pandoraea anhela]|uniref:SMF protein n=2 Tax=Pandoraea anhela TaxID=2508295 RepID=A0A5E4SR03_9BURK|nr:SMF protein [Pandoraea anhela]